MIALDTNIFIYVLNANDELGPDAAKILKNTQPKLASELVFAEILASSKLRDAKIREKVLSFLDEIDVNWRQVSKDVLLEAASLRREYPSCKIADSIHIATAIVGKADTFITNDNNLVNIKGTPVKIISLI